jgi:hypothetical protein
MKRRQNLKSIDFMQVSITLINEAYHGHGHLAICEGLGKVDPFILSYAPVFFRYTYYGNLFTAQMHAIKLFDKDNKAYTVPKYLEMARLRAREFPHSFEADVLQYLAGADAEVAKLHPTIMELRRRRNSFLAHISEQLVLKETELQAATLTIDQVREVLSTAGQIVNGLTLMWDNSMAQIIPSHTDDYKKVISFVNEALCKRADQEDAEFAQHGVDFKVPRPRDCPKK